MPQSRLVCKYNLLANTVMSAETFKRDFMHGIELCTINGDKLSDEAIQQKINAAVQRLEAELEIDIISRCRTETVDFTREAYYNWGYLTTFRPAQEVVSLTGSLGPLNQLTIPVNWVSTPQYSDERNNSRIIRIMPLGTSAEYSGIFASGLLIHVGLMGWSSIPNFWRISYKSGFKTIPADILDVIGKMAAIDVMNIVQDTTLGGGIASKSISFDGFSQSIATTSSAMYGSLSSKIEGYKKDLIDQIKKLRAQYRGLVFEVL